MLKLLIEFLLVSYSISDNMSKYSCQQLNHFNLLKLECHQGRIYFYVDLLMHGCTLADVLRYPVAHLVHVKPVNPSRQLHCPVVWLHPWLIEP